MGRNAAMVISGILTAFVLIVIIGLASGAQWLMGTAQAADPGPQAQSATVTAAPAQNSADVATLQQEVAAYKQQLQQAYQALQQAYNQIATLQAQQQQPRRFRGDGQGSEGNEPFIEPFGQGFGN